MGAHMGGDEKVNTPPQPILIQEAQALSLVQIQGHSAQSRIFVQRFYERHLWRTTKGIESRNFISGTKTSNIRLGGLALFFTFGIPLFILIITDGDVSFEGEEVLCCGSVLLGLLMAFIISYRDYT